MNKQYSQSGFTLVELLLTITFFILVAVFLIVGFRNFAQFQQYNQAVSDVEFVLNQARLDARSAVNDTSHGVHATTSSLIKFEGSGYVPSDPQNEINNYNLVTIEAELSNGGYDVVFQELSGLPQATGTITVTGVQYSASTTFTISDTGVVQ